MEALFAHTYLLLFGKLAVGGLLSLAVPPFAHVERGFYKSTAAVYLACAIAVVLGDAYLLFQYGESAPFGIAQVALWTLFAVVFSVYFVALFVDRPAVRARAFPISVLLGLAALTLTASGYSNGGVLSLTAYALPIIAGATASGAAATGMLLGHWYLIESGLDLTPLLRMHRFYRNCLMFEIGTVAIACFGLWLFAGAETLEGFSLAFGSRYAWLFVARVTCWAIALLLVSLVGKTLAIPQTMAATGLFYIAALVVAVGEIAGHWLLFRTGLPL